MSSQGSLNISDRLINCCQFSHYVVAAGQELVAQGYDPAFPAAAEPIDQLENLTLQRGFQVHLPIVGERSQSVLMPIDFEIFLAKDNASKSLLPVTISDVHDRCLNFDNSWCEESNINVILECMWNLEKAANHAQRFSGFIPCSNETLIDFIGEYKSSDLYGFHQEFDRREDIPRRSLRLRQPRSNNEGIHDHGGGRGHHRPESSGSVL